MNTQNNATEHHIVHAKYASYTESGTAHPLRRRSVLLALNTLALTGALAACGQINTPSNPHPPAQHLNALTLGDVGGTVISNLQNTSLEKYSGAQDLKNYDLLVVDGDTSTTDTIKTHPLIRKALALRKPLLFVDVSEDHKRNGIGKLIGFNTKGKSDGYLVVPVAQPSGKTFYHIYGTQPKSIVSIGAATVNATVNPLAATLSSNATDGAFATALASNITAAQKPSPKAVQDTDNQINPVQQQWIVTNSFSSGLLHSMDPYDSTHRTQTASGSITYTYNLFQDLSSNPAEGGFQDLIVSMDATADPGSPMILDNRATGRGWFVGAVNLENLMPDRTASGGLNLWKMTPVAENQTNEYSSGSSFNIGMNGYTPDASYGWNSSSSHSIQDWSVMGSSDINGTTNWRYKSSTPDMDHLGKWVTDGGDEVDNPNNLSKSTSDYHTEVVYKNNALSSNAIDVSSGITVWLYGIYQGSPPTNGSFSIKSTPYSDSVDATIDLSSVVPQQPTITYNYATSPSNTTVTGTILLPKPVTGDTVVYLKASGTSSSNVTVPEFVTVLSGQRLATFPVSINNDETTTSITVQAKYGQYTQQALLNVVANTSYDPPINTMAPDPNNWAQTLNNAPADSNWKVGNQVRYAVSYIDANGHETMGPYSSWITDDTYALPFLTNVPVGPSGTVARRVYRQFASEALNGVAGHVIKPDANGNSKPDNTDTNFRDDTW